ncbi:MAG: hypothetical protein IT303_00185 [Dehalococcoidia bacterium]|nr:hypothetical protein [Dehalococcoidia bacterium]
MKGDFSRQTFDPRKHYSAVLMQQGRVQLDADWNEQGDIARYLFETEGTDVIGPCGAPIGNAGFQVTTDGTMLFIGAGRFYADGILVENDVEKLAYDNQSKLDFPGADLKAAIEAMREQDRTLALVYLDVWRRHVTALDDPLLREVALGGPDTTTRLKTTWQVRLLPLATPGPGTEDIGRLEREAEEARANLAEIDTQLAAIDENLAQRRAEAAAARSAAIRTRIERVITQLEGERKQAGEKREELAAFLDEVRRKLKDLRVVGRPDCSTPFPEWDALFAPHGRLNARAQPGDPADDPCELPPGAGYTRLENQLYRVEVHTPGDVGTATFKWSRDNGTVVTAVTKVSGSSVFVHDLGPDDVLGFANGQWVELIDDAAELNGLPGQLARIVDVLPATNELVLDPAPTPLSTAPEGVDRDLHPKLRRWDQHGASASEAGVATSTEWVPLEDGVEVEFTGGPFATGDYWVIPARTATGDLEWPPYEVPNASPIRQDRRGIVHHFCRLALVQLKGEQLSILTDCRKLFPPLTAIEAATVPAAMHVIATSWENDAGMTPESFFKDGLRIRLDRPPAPESIDNNSLLVTHDAMYVWDGAPVPNARERVVLLGTTNIDPGDPQSILWRWDPSANGISNVANGVGLSTFSARAAANLAEYRINVTLRGRLVWHQAGRELIHVDGQAFARPEPDPATGEVRSALALPSGAGHRGSDFESWFFLRSQRTDAKTLRVVNLEFLRSFPGRADEVVHAVKEFPVSPDNPVQLGGNDIFNRIRVNFSREVQPEGEFGDDVQMPARLEFTPPRGRTSTLAAQVVVKGDLLDYRPRDPEVVSEMGVYRLIVLSAGEDDAGIRAADDGSPLDGDFDGESGASFVLRFTLG